MSRLLRYLPVLALMSIIGLGGCTRVMAERLVESPNRGSARPADGWAKFLDIDQSLQIQVGPPDATLAAWVLEPTVQPARGTILVLHGIAGSRLMLMDTARSITRAGFRAVLIDLRGHGASTGSFLTFGVTESNDLQTVLDELQRQNLAGPTVGVFGFSYGAATAIQWAAADPRVVAVVAVAPFADLAEEFPHFARTVLSPVGLWITDQEYTNILGEAGRIANFNPADASPLLAIQKTSAPVLLMHGDWDLVIPADQSRELHAVAMNHSKLIILPGRGHITAWLDPGGGVARETVAWFDEHLTP